MMKLTAFLCLIITGGSVNAQLIKGKITDAENGRPLEGISIKLKYSSKASSSTGEFSLIASPADTVWFSGIGYEPKYVTVKEWKGPIMIIALKSFTAGLNEVVITGRRNHKADSLRLRNEFAKEFNYEQLKFKDIFINSSPSRGRFEFVKIDLLQLGSLLGRKNNPQNKLKKRLLEDERQAYIDSRFSRSIVSSLTKLRGDSLLLFMDQYRPSKEELMGFSDYQLFRKIKEDLIRFTDTKKR